MFYFCCGPKSDKPAIGVNMKLYKGNGNTTSSLKMGFLSGTSRRACQILSTVGISVWHTFFIAIFKLFIKGPLFVLLMSIFKYLRVTVYLKGKVPLMARSNEIRERGVNIIAVLQLNLYLSKCQRWAQVFSHPIPDARLCDVQLYTAMLYRHEAINSYTLVL